MPEILLPWKKPGARFMVCINCGAPFIYGLNVFTFAGASETQISGFCEKCFDQITRDPKDPNDQDPTY